MILVVVCEDTDHVLDDGIGAMSGNPSYWHSTNGSKPDGTNAPDFHRGRRYSGANID